MGAEIDVPKKDLPCIILIEKIDARFSSDITDPKPSQTVSVGTLERPPWKLF